MKIDLDELSRKATAATQGEWSAHVHDRGSGIEGIAVRADQVEQIADTYDNTRWPDAQCIANANHIAANSPPVTLALIARIRRLEEELARAAGIARAHGAHDYADDFMRDAHDREEHALTMERDSLRADLDKEVERRKQWMSSCASLQQTLAAERKERNASYADRDRDRETWLAQTTRDAAILERTTAERDSLRQQLEAAQEAAELESFSLRERTDGALARETTISADLAAAQQRIAALEEHAHTAYVADRERLESDLTAAQQRIAELEAGLVQAVTRAVDEALGEAARQQGGFAGHIGLEARGAGLRSGLGDRAYQRDDLQAERDALKARIAELERVIDVNTDTSVRALADAQARVTEHWPCRGCGEPVGMTPSAIETAKICNRKLVESGLKPFSKRELAVCDPCRAKECIAERERDQAKAESVAALMREVRRGVHPWRRTAIADELRGLGISRPEELIRENENLQAPTSGARRKSL